MHPSTVPGEATPAAVPAQGHGRAVLIVDDEQTLARNIALYLGRLGWVTQLAGSAEEALQAYAALRPDVVLLDHNLPGMSGLEALTRLRSSDPQACVVMITGFGNTDLAVNAMKQGAADYLAKPLALSELRLLLERLAQQRLLQNAVDYYSRRDAGGSGLDKIVGTSTPMVALRERIAMLIEAERALTDAQAPSVLIQGETGTGKELVARALHFGGTRAARPFVELNCGALPPQLMEAELFGYERGAFTDARQRKLGLVETAEGGTLFLDEIGEADLSVQVKLLKLLEDRRFRRLGGLREQQVDLRIVAATHQPLEQRVREGRFRADLYFRLRMVELQVPPLRERPGDIALLARHFARLHGERYRRPDAWLTPAALALLERCPWPGNVRELRNAMEQGLLLARGSEIDVGALSFLQGAAAGEPARDTGVAHAAGADPNDLNLERAERRLIETALDRTHGNVTQAARLLGVSRDTLRYRLERLNIKARGEG